MVWLRHAQRGATSAGGRAAGGEGGGWLGRIGWGNWITDSGEDWPLSVLHLRLTVEIMSTEIRLQADPETHVDAVRERLVSGPLARTFLSSLATLTSFYLMLSVTPMYAAAAGAGSAGAGLVTGVLLLGTVIAELGAAPLMRRYRPPSDNGTMVGVKKPNRVSLTPLAVLISPGVLVTV
jgi:hypothetical protein